MSSTKKCPGFEKGVLDHDNSVCPYRFARTIWDWIRLPEELQTLTHVFHERQQRGKKAA